MGLKDFLQHGWNVFNKNRDPTYHYYEPGVSHYYRPDRPRFSRGNERSIVTALYNRIAMDAAAIDIRHVKLDENERYIETVDSGLNRCLSIEANIDQSGRALKQDFYMSMMDEGCIAVVPVDTDMNPDSTGSYTIESMRTGRIVEWKPSTVKVSLYNDRNGKHEDVWVSKRNAAILENPFYSVMNEPNSTMQRLVRKLNILDAIDEQCGSGKLDLIIQLPYVVKSDARKKQADARRKDLEDQLAGSKYGIGYIDGTERVTQLNRPVENNLMKQIEFLTSMLYSQLGMTQSILDGTADEATMLNYYKRTIEPLVSVPVDEFKRKFLTKTARSQRHSVMYFRSMFNLVPFTELAKSADAFTRNEIMTSNEFRQVIGLKPSTDPKADQLVNSNISKPTTMNDGTNKTEGTNTTEGVESQNGETV